MEITLSVELRKIPKKAIQILNFTSEKKKCKLWRIKREKKNMKRLSLNALISLDYPMESGYGAFEKKILIITFVCVKQFFRYVNKDVRDLSQTNKKTHLLWITSYFFARLWSVFQPYFGTVDQCVYICSRIICTFYVYAWVYCNNKKKKNGKWNGLVPFLENARRLIYQVRNCNSENKEI